MTTEEKLKEQLCFKCGHRVNNGMGSLQSKITNGKLVHIKCPKKAKGEKDD